MIQVTIDLIHDYLMEIAGSHLCHRVTAMEDIQYISLCSKRKGGGGKEREGRKEGKKDHAEELLFFSLGIFIKLTGTFYIVKRDSFQLQETFILTVASSK